MLADRPAPNGTATAITARSPGRQWPRATSSRATSAVIA